jgi:hypothetical protein
VRSGPEAARTILPLHIISARLSKQTRMVGSTLGVYSFGLIFVSARTKKRHHHLSRLRFVTDSKNLFIGQYDTFFEEYWLSPIS